MIPLRRPYLGIDLGDREVKAVLLRKKARGWQVDSVFRSEVTGDDDESRAASRQEALRRIARTTQLRAPITTLGMPAQQATLKVINLPATDRRSLEQILRFEAPQHIPFRADNAEIDFDLLGRPTDDLQRVALAACDKGALNSYRSALRSGGLRPSVVDVGVLAAANCFATRPSALEVPEPDGVIVADLGARRTLVTVLQHGAFHSHRVVPFGGDALTDALVQDFGVARDEAESLKRQHGLAPPAQFASEGPEATPGADGWLDRLTAELRIIAQSYQAETRTGQVGRVLLAGGGALAEGLPEALSRRLQLEVFVPNPWATFEMAAGLEASPEQAPQFASATGLALRGDRPLVAVNLATQIAREAGAAQRGRVRSAAVAGLAGAVLVVAGSQLTGRLETKRVELEALTRECLKHQPAEPAQAETGIEVTELVRRASISRYNGRLWLELLQRLSSDLPEGVWLEEAHFDKGGAVSIRGSALTSREVADAVSAIRRIPALTEVRLTYANIVQRGDKQMVQFQTLCTVVTKGGVAS